MSERSLTADNHDEIACPSIVHLSEFREAAILYIAGFVAQIATKQLICAACCIALVSRKGYTSSNFIQLKDHGNLFKPTSSVIRVCKDTKKCNQRMVLATDGKLPQYIGLSDVIAVSVLGYLGTSDFSTDLQSHVLESAVDDNHIFQLIKIIVKCYCKVRFYHLGKETTDKIGGTKIRKLLSKLILFKNQ